MRRPQSNRRLARMPAVAIGSTVLLLVVVAALIATSRRRPELRRPSRELGAAVRQEAVVASAVSPTIAAAVERVPADAPESGVAPATRAAPSPAAMAAGWRGQVVRRRDGAPLAGAVVELHPAAPLASPLEPALPAGAAPLGTVRADADGRFRFAAVPALADAGWLLAATTGCAAACVSLPRSDAQELRIELEEGRTLRGQVVAAEDGRLLASVRVSVFLGGVAPRELAGAESDGVGAFEFDGLPAEVVGLACIPTGRWRTTSLKCDLRGSDRLAERVVLTAGGEVRGQVRDPAGAAVAGATVGEGFAGGKQATTDIEGRFRLEGVAIGAIELFVRHGEAALAQQRVVVPEAGSLTDVDVVLTAGRSVRGRVVDPAGAPIAGASVLAEAAGFVGGRQQLDRVRGATAADGVFELTGLRTDLRHRLLVAARGCATLDLALLGEEGTTHDAEPAPLDVGEVVLAAESLLEVRRRFGDGTPAAGVSITLVREPAPDAPPPRPRAAITDVDGCARFDRLAVGAYRVLDDARQPPARAQRVVVAAAGERLVVEGLAGERIVCEGTVELPDGGPAADLCVEAFGDDGERLLATRTDREGRFRLRLLGSRVDLHATPAAAGPAELARSPPALAAVARAVVAAGGPVRLRLAPGEWAHGRVVAADGAPLAGATLARFAPGRADPRGIGGTLFSADRDGRFVCALAPGEACDVVAISVPQPGGGGAERSLRSACLRLTAAADGALATLIAATDPAENDGN